MSYDFVIVGAGLTGATLARSLADADRRVLVLEREANVGGNCADALDPESGLLVNAHGPHYFRTNSKAIWDFVNRFASWWPFEAQVSTLFQDRLYPWPICEETCVDLCGPQWRDTLRKDSPAGNFEEAALGKFPPRVYERFVKPYTEKQWGVAASSLRPELAKRIDVRLGLDRRFTQHKYQALPRGGYTRFIDSMLVHRNIRVELNCTETWTPIVGSQLIWTGAIDEFFDYRLGALRYRHQQRFFGSQAVSGESKWPGPQVNTPHTPPLGPLRQIEWKHMQEVWPSRLAGQSWLTYETPCDSTDTRREYPFPDTANEALAQRYERLAEREVSNVIFAGRLGTYRYLDMDQAIGAALTLTRRVLSP